MHQQSGKGISTKTSSRNTLSSSLRANIIKRQQLAKNDVAKCGYVRDALGKNQIIEKISQINFKNFTKLSC